MSFGVYFHIPYCIQRCRYCDFTTFEQNSILPPKDYIEYVKKEIRQNALYAPSKKISSIYFGGGTPSLIESELITSLIDELRMAGFQLLPDAELTIEINPATVDEKKLNHYLENSINRFSVGAQSFKDDFLKACGREHSAQDTEDTLMLLKKYNVSFTADILFALPQQALQHVEEDTKKLLSFEPRHISAYCLTVPKDHIMSTGRAPEEEQIEMFKSIEDLLSAHGVFKYEISNFSKSGHESKHNMVYWSDQPFWGLGLSAHSYFPEFDQTPFGIRFWNPSSFAHYFKSLENPEEKKLPAISGCYEILHEHESITDFCHMFLRTQRGLPLDAVRKKFPRTASSIEARLSKLSQQGLVELYQNSYRLTTQGSLLSNEVFRALTFSEDEI
jgi:oxygen-independent coproporphyrinogen-3 oxidase